MSATFKGTTDIIEQAPRRSWSSTSGYSTVRVWVGERLAIETFAPSLREAGAETFSIDPDGPTATLTATFPDPQDASFESDEGALNVEWQLLGNDLEKNLRTHSSMEPAYGFDGSVDREQMNAAEAAVRDGNPADPAWGTKAANLYAMLSMGVEAYVVTQYVVRKSIKVGRGSDVRASHVGVNRIELPPFGDGIIKLFELPENTGDLTTIEWLKKPPTIVALGRGKFSIDQEWWGARRWSAILYGGTATP